MKVKTSHLALMLVAVILGFMLAVQFRATREAGQTPPVQRAASLVNKVSDDRKKRDELQSRVNELRDKLDNAATRADLHALKDELTRARIEAGLSEVQGPGIEVTLNDSNLVAQKGENPNLYVLHDEDVLKVLNELRAAGAEAMALNDQRLVATSEIRCIGPSILVNKNQRLAPPFVIYAIGNQDNMINALKMRGGVIESLQFWGIQVNAKKLPQITVPPLTGGVKFEYARAAAVEKGE